MFKFLLCNNVESYIHDVYLYFLVRVDMFVLYLIYFVCKFNVVYNSGNVK